jgi:glycosyltransferase involved in cell wall biosynthesis
MEYNNNILNKYYLIVVIPVYNEEENVVLIYREIRDSIYKIGTLSEIIFVDDGIADRTLEILKDIKVNERRETECLAHTRIIQFSRNFGQTAAMLAGFDQASGGIIVSIDGDLQNDPKDIPILTSQLEEGYDLVCGWRKNRQDKVLTRKIPSKIANLLIKKIAGVDIQDLKAMLITFQNAPEPENVRN